MLDFVSDVRILYDEALNLKNAAQYSLPYRNNNSAVCWERAILHHPLYSAVCWQIAILYHPLYRTVCAKEHLPCSPPPITENNIPRRFIRMRTNSICTSVRTRNKQAVFV